MQENEGGSVIILQPRGPMPKDSSGRAAKANLRMEAEHLGSGAAGQQIMLHGAGAAGSRDSVGWQERPCT